MVNVPEFDLNDPFTLSEETLDAHPSLTEKERQDLLNQMWRNACINDTYEPGSTFKVITASAGLEEGVVSTSDAFFCPGYKIVEDRLHPLPQGGRPRLGKFHPGNDEFLQPGFHGGGAAAGAGADV